jgi:vancomycin resistance protein YoaR
MQGRKAVIVLTAFLFLTMLPACHQKPDTPTAPETRRLEAEQDIAGQNPPVTVVEKTVRPGVRLGGKKIGDLKESEVLTIIRTQADKMEVRSKNASLNKDTWKVTPGKMGKKVNVQKTLEKALSAAEGEKITYVVEEVKPDVTSEELSANIVVIGKFTTPIINRGSSRMNNIRVASKKINFKKLASGEEFSFNRVLGRRTEAKGYEEAPIIIKTEEGPKNSKGVGGGICQVSTTIYNAIEHCKGLDILERHIHSKDIKYVPRGEDATVAYGSADFRFKNNRSHPIMIRIYPNKKSITVEIIENRN